MFQQWFDCAGKFKNGFAAVGLNNKYNFINTKEKLLSQQGFDGVGGYDGYAAVLLNDEWNFINTKGQIF